MPIRFVFHGMNQGITSRNNDVLQSTTLYINICMSFYFDKIIFVNIINFFKKRILKI